jgi:hypothetical protein
VRPQSYRCSLLPLQGAGPLNILADADELAMNSANFSCTEFLEVRCPPRPFSICDVFLRPSKYINLTKHKTCPGKESGAIEDGKGGEEKCSGHTACDINLGTGYG